MITHGNSGGPLISLVTGKVVGISTAAIIDRNVKNTGFAVAARYACRVIELLRAGQDPSPPEMAIVFYKDIDDRRILKIAKVTEDSLRMGFAIGQEIRRVEGDDRAIENTTQLMHGLRGRLTQASLVVGEGAQEKRVAGAVPPAARVTERRGVFAGGALFSDNLALSDMSFQLPPIAVHYVEEGSLAASEEIHPLDALETIDGQPVSRVGEVHALFDRAKREGRPAALTLRRFDFEPRLMSVLVERKLDVSRLEWVGEQ